LALEDFFLFFYQLSGKVMTYKFKKYKVSLFLFIIFLMFFKGKFFRIILPSHDLKKTNPSPWKALLLQHGRKGALLLPGSWVAKVFI
jgi:hypothetical protein